MKISKEEVDRLVGLKLLQVKTYTEGKYKGLSVLKYTKRCFWDNRWNESPLLLECRGLVIDEDYNVIVRPLKKIFNIGESECAVDADDQNLYQVHHKKNGYMIAYTPTAKYGWIASTTGSLDSDHIEMVESKLHNYHVSAFVNFDWSIKYYSGYYTAIFEACLGEDPHVIEGDCGTGLWLLGLRNIETGEYYPNPELKHSTSTVSSAVEQTKLMDTEGVVLYDTVTQQLVGKVKSPYYLTKKALQRMGLNTVVNLFDNPDSFKKRIDEEFYDVVDFVVSTYTKEQWYEFTEQERAAIIYKYFNKE